jgi:tryptophanyl-tRNA synthetase
MKTFHFEDRIPDFYLSAVEGVRSVTGDAPPVALTGDRTTGPLHLGHYAGSLRKRVQMQRTHDQYVMLADAQALTDNGRDPGRIRANVLEVAADYLATGLDPMKTTIFVQSAVPALARLSMLYLNLVTVSRLERNPTVRHEIAQKDMQRDIPAGFLCYPAAQAADITAFKAVAVPCGDDQLPMIEQSNEIVHRINAIAGREVLPKSHAITSKVTRLPGIDGKAKASKSMGNAIALSSTAQEVEDAVRAMYTDPGHVRASDPGRVEGNVVFAHLDAFDPDRAGLEEMKAHYARGGLGDMVVKKKLMLVLKDMLEPIRERRAEAMARPDDLMDMLRTGTRKAIATSDPVADEIEDALGLFRL